MSFFYPTRWQNPYHPRYHNSSMYGLGAAQAQAGAQRFTAEQQAAAAEIDFLLAAAKNSQFQNAMQALHATQAFTPNAVNFLNEWATQALKAPNGILNINPFVGGQGGEQTGYDVIHGMYEKITDRLVNWTDLDEAGTDKVFSAVIASYPNKAQASATIWDVIDKFADLTDAYHDAYFSDTAIEKKPVRRFGWGKYLLWGGLALGGVLLIAGAMKARR